MPKMPDIKASDLRGIVGYMITPIREGSDRRTEFAVNLDESARLADALIRDQVSALVLNGTFGEVGTLTWEELSKFTETVIETTAGRVPVFAGVTTLSTRETLRRARAFRDMGATGLNVGRPMLAALSDDNIVRYHQDIAEELPDMAMMLYDDIEAFKRPLTTNVYRELAKIPQIVGCKYRTRLLIAGATANTYNLDLDAVGNNIKLMPSVTDWYFAYKMFDIDVAWGSSVNGGPAPLIALRDAIGERRMDDARTIAREIAWAYEDLIPKGDHNAWHMDKIPFMKARYTASGYVNAGPALPPYHYLSPERTALARELGQRSGALHERYKHKTLQAAE